jgi:hypothetical protein
MAIQNSISGIPQTSVAYRGQTPVNGMPVGPKDGYKILGGFLDPNDVNNAGISTLTFGYAVSALPATPAQFVVGQPTGYIFRGVAKFDESIAYNQPFLPGGYIIGTDATLISSGWFRISSYNKTATGAIDPVLGSLVIVDITTGEIQFVAAGTASAPTGWEFLKTVSGANALSIVNIEANSGVGSGVGVVLSVQID